MSDYNVDLTGKSRAEIVAIRARLMGDGAFGKALMAGEADARLALQAISKALVDDGGGALSQSELGVRGFDVQDK